MKRIFFFVVCLGGAISAIADGLPLTNGRYTSGPILVLKLTEDQKNLIARFRSCHLENFKTMNVYTPYVFMLSSEQASALKKRKGISPRRFQVYETYRGSNDAGPHWNLALRFSEDEIEIPLDLVITDSAAKKNHDMQGWKEPNPCVQPTSASGRG